MPIAPYEAIVVKKVGESGSDGTTDNDERTLPVYVGGQNFSIILVIVLVSRPMLRYRLIILTLLIPIRLIMLYTPKH